MHTSCRISAKFFVVLFLWAVLTGLLSDPVHSSDFGGNTLRARLEITAPSTKAIAQKPPKKKEIRLMVKGNCGQCERRIMESLDQKGIIAAGWDRQKQEAWVVYRPGLVTEEQIHAYIAAAGHDTGLKKADHEVYKSLPQCCLYRDSNNLHD
jgi:hypothetical protein